MKSYFSLAKETRERIVWKHCVDNNDWNVKWYPIRLRPKLKVRFAINRWLSTNRSLRKERVADHNINVFPCFMFLLFAFRTFPAFYHLTLSSWAKARWNMFIYLFKELRGKSKDFRDSSLMRNNFSKKKKYLLEIIENCSANVHTLR